MCQVCKNDSPQEEEKDLAQKNIAPKEEVKAQRSHEQNILKQCTGSSRRGKSSTQPDAKDVCPPLNLWTLFII